MKGVFSGMVGVQKSASFHELRQVQVSSDPRKIESLGSEDKRAVRINSNYYRLL